MTDTGSKLPEYMPRRPDAPKNIMDLLGGAKRWDIEVSDILDQEFVVLSIDPKVHMGKDVSVCSVLVGDEQKIMLLNSISLTEQLMPLQDDLPLLCKVTRKGKRYRFTL